MSSEINDIPKDKNHIIKNENLTNSIYNINKEDIKCLIDNLSNNKNFDKDISNNLIILLNDTFSENGLLCRSSFIKYHTITLKKIFDNFSSYDFELRKINFKECNNTNNEIVFITSFMCYSYILKILSERKNGKHCIIAEINNSKFFNNIVFNNTCPHFSVYISDFFVGKSICNFKLNNHINHCIVYHYINSWKLKINEINYKVADFGNLLNILFRSKNKFTQTTIDNILYNALFQVFYSILTMSAYKMNHNDLRPCNIMINGNYNFINKYDLYIINTKNEVLKYYLPNLGFKIKIIDYGLSNSEHHKDLNNPSAVNFHISNEAGIYPYYSNVSDQHYFINDILSRNINITSPNVYLFLRSIIDIKYLGTKKNNIYLCEYWRLAFPYTIEYFISKMKQDYIIDSANLRIASEKYNIKLFPSNIIKSIKYICLYNLSYIYDRVEINDLLVDHLLSYIQFMSNTDFLNSSIFNMLNDPLDNNSNLILKPLEIIKKFSMYSGSNISDGSNVSEDQILNKYELNYS
jgi:hypothetical protein